MNIRLLCTKRKGEMLCAVVALFMTLSSAHAQSRIGADFGLDIGTWHLDNRPLVESSSEKLDYHYSVSGAVSVDFQLHQEWLLSTGLRYSDRGTSAEATRYNAPEDRADFNLKYLEIPIYVKYEVLSTPIVIRCMLGATFGYLLSANLVINNYSLGDILQALKKYDASMDTGIQLGMPISRRLEITLTGLYSYGLVHLNKDLSTWVTSMSSRDGKVMAGLGWTLH